VSDVRVSPEPPQGPASNDGSAYARAMRGLRRVVPSLPRSVWLLEGGALWSAVGTGLVSPFVLIYLHNARGFGFGTTGLVYAAYGAATVVLTPVAGTVIDAVGARRSLLGASLLQAAGWGTLAVAHRPWQAAASFAVAGIGNAAFWSSQATLVTGLTGGAQRATAFALHRIVHNLGLAAGGVAGGLIVRANSPHTFMGLFIADALSFALFGLAALAVPEARREQAERTAGSYRDVLRDRPFLGVLAVNAAMTFAGFAVFESVLPVFAKNDVGLSTRAIGGLFALNVVMVVVLQLPVTRLIEGRRRMLAIAASAAVWTACAIGAFASAEWLHGNPAVVLVFGVIAIFTLGELVFSPTHAALSADLAPERMRGRYLSLVTNSFAIGYTAGPAAGAALLGVSSAALWFPVAAVLAVTALGSLALDRALPPDVAIAPRT
jgi:MFS family permease